MDDTVSLCRTCGSRYSSRAWPWLERPDGAPDLRVCPVPGCVAAGRECNVRWATRTENCRNRRSNKRITYRGETKTMVEWTDVLGLNVAAVDKRIAAGWSIERAFEEPIRYISPKGCGPRTRAPRLKGRR